MAGLLVLRVTLLVLLFALAKAASELVPQSIEPNGICKKNFECRTGFTCAPTQVPKETRCMTIRTAGGQCNDLQDCAQSLKLRCIRGVCVEPGKFGTPCEQYLDDGDCVEGFTCINRTCSRHSDKNGTCDVFWNCKRGLTCIKKQCREKSRHGGDCDSSIDCENAVCTLNSKGEYKCDSDIGSIFGSLIAFTFVIVTTSTLQFCAWRPRRR